MRLSLSALSVEEDGRNLYDFSVLQKLYSGSVFSESNFCRFFLGSDGKLAKKIDDDRTWPLLSSNTLDLMIFSLESSYISSSIFEKLFSRLGSLNFWKTLALIK